VARLAASGSGDKNPTPAANPAERIRKQRRFALEERGSSFA
jgi:hypothetical protein